jgi:hypothetical protein
MRDASISANNQMGVAEAEAGAITIAASSEHGIDGTSFVRPNQLLFCVHDQKLIFKPACGACAAAQALDMFVSLPIKHQARSATTASTDAASATVTPTDVAHTTTTVAPSKMLPPRVPLSAFSTWTRPRPPRVVPKFRPPTFCDSIHLRTVSPGLSEHDAMGMLAKSPSTCDEAEKFFEVRRELILSCEEQQKKQLRGLAHQIAVCKKQTNEYQTLQRQLNGDIFTCRAVLNREKARSDSFGDGVGHTMSIVVKSKGFVKHGDIRATDLHRMGNETHDMVVKVRKRKKDADHCLVRLAKARHIYELSRLEKKLLAQRLECVRKEKGLYITIMHGEKCNEDGKGQKENGHAHLTKTSPRKKSRR